MYLGATSFAQEISKWKIGNVTIMWSIFNEPLPLMKFRRSFLQLWYQRQDLG